MKCRLCLKNEANQTGSHITSAFLLTSQIGKRDEEKGFLITENPFQNYSINVKADDLKEDFIFCRTCEKRMSYVEDYYSREITQKIEIPKYSANFEQLKKNGTSCVSCKKIHPIAFHLMIYSIIWRASTSKQPIFKYFTLSPVIESELRFLLDLFLPEVLNFQTDMKLNAWIQLIDKCKDIFEIQPYIILKAENLQHKDETFDFFDNVSKSPNHIMVNEYIILSFFNGQIWHDDFFSLKAELEKESLLNSSVDSCRIGILSNERYLKIVEKIRNAAIQKRYK